MNMMMGAAVAANGAAAKDRGEEEGQASAAQAQQQQQPPSPPRSSSSWRLPGSGTGTTAAAATTTSSPGRISNFLSPDRAGGNHHHHGQHVLEMEEPLLEQTPAATTPLMSSSPYASPDRQQQRQQEHSVRSASPRSQPMIRSPPRQAFRFMNRNLSSSSDGNDGLPGGNDENHNNHHSNGTHNDREDRVDDDDDDDDDGVTEIDLLSNITSNLNRPPQHVVSSPSSPIPGTGTGSRDFEDNNGGGGDNAPSSNIPLFSSYEIASRVLGRAYTIEGGYWFSLLASLALGFVVSVLGLAFILSLKWIRHLWLGNHITLQLPSSNGYDGNNHNDDNDDDDDDRKNPMQSWYHWHWIMITTFGGFVAGLIMYLFGGGGGGDMEDRGGRFTASATTTRTNSVSFAAATTTAHCIGGGGGGGGGASNPATRMGVMYPILSLQGSHSCRYDMVVILCSFIAIASGAPLGPELAITILSTRFATKFANLCHIGGRGAGSGGDGDRTRALWILVAVTSGLGGCLYGAGPILGPLLVWEFILTTRPDAITVDAVLQQRWLRQQQIFHQRRHGQGHQQQRQSIPREPIISSNNHNNSRQHDYMEILSLQMAGTIVAILVVQHVLDAFHAFDDNNDNNGSDNNKDLLLSPFSKSLSFNNVNDDMTTNNIGDDDTATGIDPAYYGFELWHVLVAVPIGLLCGFVGNTLITMTYVFAWIRAAICSMLGSSSSRPIIPIILFPTLAGLLHGIISVACPYAAIDWYEYIRTVTIHPMELIEQHIMTSHQLIWIIVAKILGISICFGFGEMVGGLVIPTITIGASLGLLLTSWASFLPYSLTIPCCLAACPVSICPVPMSAVVAVILLIGTSADQTTPIFVAVMSSWAVSGAIGHTQRLVSKAKEHAYHLHHHHHTTTTATTTSPYFHFHHHGNFTNVQHMGDFDDDGHEDNDGQPLFNEDEILNNVRSLIFGSTA